MESNDINEHFLNIHHILDSKGIKVPRCVEALMKRLLHIDEINEIIYKNRHKEGVDFATAAMSGNEPYNLNIKIVARNIENIPTEGHPIIAGNHPLGGADGLALIDVVGRRRRDILFPVNDFLMLLPGLKSLFVPIDKVHHSKSKMELLEQAFASDKALLYFPAGLCSRRQPDGTIHDPKWKPTYVKKAVEYGRDIVPFYFEASNRKRFYRIAHLREKMGIRFNFEMALLPAELFAQRGKEITVTFGKAIPYTTFDRHHSPKEWAALLEAHTYRLKDNPEAPFEA